jgi:predicted RecB family nuclease
MLKVAVGIKDVLANAGFTTIDSLLRLSAAELAAVLGIEFYVAKIIRDAAKKAAGKGDDEWFEEGPNVHVATPTAS